MDNNFDCQFSAVNSLNEYHDVLKLRHSAYKEANKITIGKEWFDMGDEFDKRSVIVIAKHKNKIVGSVRTIFHGENDKLSYERYFNTPPPQLPDRSFYAECSRMCTEPSMRHLKLFFPLSVRAIKSAIAHKRRYIVGGSMSGIMKLWERCGFRTIDAKYQSLDMVGLEHQMAVLDTKADLEKLMEPKVYKLFKTSSDSPEFYSIYRGV
jgi:hypothetical protein